MPSYHYCDAGMNIYILGNFRSQANTCIRGAKQMEIKPLPVWKNLSHKNLGEFIFNVNCVYVLCLPSLLPKGGCVPQITSIQISSAEFNRIYPEEMPVLSWDYKICNYLCRIYITKSRFGKSVVWDSFHNNV